jgi:hypothetical protein
VTDEGDPEAQPGKPPSVPGGSGGREPRRFDTDSAAFRIQAAKRRRLRRLSLAAALAGVVLSVGFGLVFKSSVGSPSGLDTGLVAVIATISGGLGSLATELLERAGRAIEPKLAHLAADDIWDEIWKNSEGRRSPT